MLTVVIDLIRELSIPLKMGWLLWMVWCVAQIAWYWRGRAIPEQQWHAPRFEARKRPTVDPRIAEPRSVEPGLEVPAEPAVHHSYLEVAAALPADLQPQVASKPPKRRRRHSADSPDAVATPI